MLAPLRRVLAGLAPLSTVMTLLSVYEKGITAAVHSPNLPRNNLEGHSYLPPRIERALFCALLYWPYRRDAPYVSSYT